MIVLRFPDGTTRRLENDEAERLAGILWDVSQDGHTATVAAAIQSELRYANGLSRTVDVPQRNAPRVAEALSRL
jgi:hypothetical protein